MEKLLIKNIPIEERPRERLLNYGAQNLSNEELLAIILKTGTKNESVKILSNKVLIEVGNISNMKNISINKLLNIKGIGKVKAIELKAALELGKRVYYNKLIDNKSMNNGQKVFDYFQHYFSNLKQEHFYCLYLNTKYKLIDKKLLFIGTLNKSVVHPREIFKEAYLMAASSIICVHNHPSGDVSPSKEDIYFTKNLIEIGKIQGIPIIDHIIIGNNSYYSFYEKNNI